MIMQGNRNSWNSNFLKWASGFIGGSDQSKKTESAPVINYCFFFLFVSH